MQMNIYVPKGKKAILAALDRAAKRTSRPKNDLVLEALERYLAEAERSRELEHFKLGEMRPGTRGDLYQGRLEP